MRKYLFFVACVMNFLLMGCAAPITQHPATSLPMTADNEFPYSNSYDESKYIERLPQHIETGNEKVLMVDPKLFAWGAYNAHGDLIRGGIATAGGNYCADEGKPCRTKTGTFRLTFLGNENCASKTYPIPDGGALMPYCMFFHDGQSFHGSPDKMLIEQNISHGCVHIRIPDAEWIRYHFAEVGTKVIILPY